MVRKRKLLWVFSGLFLMIIAGLSLLNHIDFGGETAGIVRQAVTTALGFELELKDPRGNPMTGFSAGDLVLSDGETVLASADSVEMRLSPLSVGKGRVIISSLVLAGLNTSPDHLGTLLASLREQRNGKSNGVELRTLEIEESTLETRSGPLTIHKGKARLQKDATVLELSMILGGHKTEIEGTLRNDPGSLVLTELKGSIDGNPFDLKGSLYPRTDLEFEGRNLPMDLLPLLFPDLDPRKFGGKATLSIHLTRDTAGFDIRGNMAMDQATAGGFHFTRTQASLSFREGLLSFSDLVGSINGSSVQGELGMLFRTGQPILWSVRARGQNLEIALWKERFSWLKPFSGNARAIEVNLKGPSTALQGTVALEKANVEIMDKAFGGLTGNIDLSLPKSVSLELEGFWCSSPVRVTGKVLPAEDPGLSVDITSRAFCLKDVRGLNGWLEQLIPEGDMAGNLKVRGTRDAPRLSWDLRSDRIRLKGELLEEMTLSGSTLGDGLEIEHASATWRGGRLEATGALESLSSRTQSRLSMTGTLATLPLDRLESSPALQGSASGNWSLSGTPEGVALQAQLGVDHPRWGNLSARKLDLRGKWKDREIALEKVVVTDFMQGTIEGKGNLFLQEGGATDFNLSGMLSGIHLASLKDTMVPEGTDLAGILEGPFSLTGNGEKPLFTLDASTKGLSLFGLPLKKASGKITWAREGLSLEGWSIPLWGGKTDLEGTVTFGGKGEPLNLQGTFHDLDLLLASQVLKLPVRLSGQTAGKFSLRGTPQNPTVSLEAEAPKLYLDGFGSSEARLRAQGPLSDIAIESFEARVGQSGLSGKGRLTLTEPWAFGFEVGGEELDLGTLIRTATPGTGFTPSGLGNLRATGTLSARGLSGEGCLDASSVGLWGLRFEKLHIPFVLLEGYLTVEEGEGTLYGGALQSQWTMGLKEEQWGGNISVKGADLSQAVRDAFRPEGDVSGTADFRLRLSGAYGKAFLLDGTGALEVRDGQVKGFASQKELAEILDFRSLSASFSIDGKTLYLLPGSRISAPPGNRLYRYVSVDGSIVPGGPLDLSGYGDVNLQALNAFLGGLQGLFAAGESSEEQVQQFLSGLLGGVTNARNFREVEFTIQGDWERPRLTKLRTVAAERANAFSPIPASPSDPEEKKGSDRISLKLEIPTGQGGNGETNGMGEQIKQQILEQILREILGPDDGDGDTEGF